MANVGKKWHFKLKISSERYLEYYKGVVRSVSVMTKEGQRMEFPANVLRPFVTQDGVEGDFVVECDNDNKFISIKKINP